MKANTAFCFVLCGTALLVGYLSRPRAWKKTCSLVLAVLVVLIAGVTLFEYVTGLSLGLDQLLLPRLPASIGTSNPGRMSPNSAVAFLLFGAALILLSRGPRGALMAHVLTLVGLFIALLALIGYLFNAADFRHGLFLYRRGPSYRSSAFGCSAWPSSAPGRKRASWPPCWPTARAASSPGA